MIFIGLYEIQSRLTVLCPASYASKDRVAVLQQTGVGLGSM